MRGSGIIRPEYYGGGVESSYDTGVSGSMS
jgi:hypothetical protein